MSTRIVSVLIVLLLGEAKAAEVLLPGPEGKPLPILIPADSSETHEAAAKTLATTLERLFSVPFPVVTEAEGPAIRLTVSKGPEPTSLEREAYTIVTGAKGIELTGVTDLALRHAVWGLLHHLGYRQYFPGPTWEIVPKLDSISLDLDVRESPDYASRRIWYGFGLWDHNGPDYRDWVERNRMEGGFSLNTGHAYGRLVRSQQATFDAHPEYYALVDGKRQTVPEAKLCIANPGLREAAIAYALAFFDLHLRDNAAARDYLDAPDPADFVTVEVRE